MGRGKSCIIIRRLLNSNQKLISKKSSRICLLLRQQAKKTGKTLISTICTQNTKNFNNNWNFFKLKKKLSEFRVYHLSLDNFWRQLTKILELWVRLQDLITTLEFCPLWIENF